MDIGLPAFRNTTFFFSMVLDNKLRDNVKTKIEKHGGTFKDSTTNFSVDYVLADKKNIHCVRSTVGRLADNKVPWFDYNAIDYWIRVGFIDIKGAKDRGLFLGLSKDIKINNTNRSLFSKKRKKTPEKEEEEESSSSEESEDDEDKDEDRKKKRTKKSQPIGDVVVMNYKYDDLPGRTFNVTWKSRTDTFHSVKSHIVKTIMKSSGKRDVDYRKIRFIPPFTLEWSSWDYED